jgi:multidrug resistance efflux pump
MRHVIRKTVAPALAALLLAGCSTGAGPQPESTPAPSPAAQAPTQAPVVASGDVLAVAEGVVLPQTSLDLRFPFKGIVSQVLVEEGQKVKAGDVLARLDIRQLELDLERAQIALEQSRLNLEEMQSGPRKEEVDIQQARLAVAQAQLQVAITTVNQSDVAAARETATASEQGLAELVAGPKTTEVTAARASVDKARADLERARDQLSANKTNLELRMQQVANDLRIAQDNYSRLYWRNAPGREAGSLSQQELDEEAAAKRAVENLELQLKQARVDFEEAKQAEANGISASEANLRGAEADLEKLLAGPDQSDVTATRAAVARTSADLERLAGENREANVTAARARLAEAQSSLALLTAGASEFALEQAALAVRLAEVQLKQTRLNLDSGVLAAPFDATVTSLNMRPGASSEEAVIQLADLNAWRVETEDLSELDVVRIREGNKVKLTFVAVPGLELTGRVERLRMVEKVNQPAAYRAVIAPDGWDDQLLWNMSASITVLSE